MLRIYEYTQEGFDGATDDTDSKVFWIAAPDEDTANAIGSGLGMKRTGDLEGTFSAQQAHVTGADIVCTRQRMFRNTYRHCRQEWTDEWSCACNDKCPMCNAEIEPSASEEYWVSP